MIMGNSHFMYGGWCLVVPGVNEPKPADSPVFPDSGLFGSPSAETLCFQLGWSMERLYRARPFEPAGAPRLPDRLPGLSRLTRLERAEIDYGRVHACLSGLSHALSWPGDQVPSIAGIGTCLAGLRNMPPAGLPPPATDAGDDEAGDYQAAVLRGHLNLITTIEAAGATLGKAYNLGRALADTCRPHQDQASLQRNFEPNRLAHLMQDLRDLASALPPHAAKAVVQSMTWWRDTVYLADRTELGQDRRNLLGSVRTDAPGLRTRQGMPNKRMSTAAPSGDPELLQQVLPRQGELWRVVLTGEKAPLDLLSTDDYLAAARRAVDQGRRIAARTLVAAPMTTVSLFVLITGVLAAVLAVIYASHASYGGKLAAFLVAVGGYLASLARAAGPRFRSAAKAVEHPLWQAALDYVSAEAISVAPVGMPDVSGWSRLARVPAPSTGSAPGTGNVVSAGHTGAAAPAAPAPAAAPVPAPSSVAAPEGGG